MLPSIAFIDAPDQNHQSSIKNRTQNANNGKSLKAVVLHHPLLSTPPEDWVLFPEQIIRKKHSSVRNFRARQAKERLQPAKPSRSSPTRTTELSRSISITSRSESTSVSTEEPRDQSDSSSKLDRPRDVAKSNSNVAIESPREPPKVKAPQRLPTPDISDVEEDGFWSCCGSSERSL
ncbi:hypothetical protein MMC07_002729 [Pseudocyphellaria aurata]|nr:hypothetical protein [Pseudocyphellaria aurata]